MQTTRGRRVRGFSQFSKAMAGAGLLAIALATSPLIAGPDGAQVQRGNVTFERIGNKLVIRASNGSIINYDSFNIGRGEHVRFMQPGKMSRVLNRVMGAGPSIIEGRLSANGQVYLVNPAGVMFAPGSRVDVGGLFAAAGTLSDADFVRKVDRFKNLSGDVVNHGLLEGETLALMGEHVANHGIMRADQEGLVVMAAGDSVLIQRHGDKVTVKVDGERITDRNTPSHGETTPDMAAQAGVENTGVVKATKGQIVLGAGDLYSLAVRNSGRVTAAKGDVTVAALDGAVHNTARGEISADANKGQAGTVMVQGPTIVNDGEITADANKGTAGSTTVVSQDHTYLREGSVVSADGTGKADGGEVLVHSYNGTTVLDSGARVSANGGRGGGDGGFVELSGESLAMQGTLDARGRKGGEHGTVLIDPYNIYIEDTGSDDGLLGDGLIDFNEPDGLTDAVISDEALEAIVGDIVLQASMSMYVNQQVDLVNNNNVRLEAYHDIIMNEAINGANNLEVYADVDNHGGGLLFLNAPLDVGNDATFDGQIIYLNNSTLNSQGTQTYLRGVTLCVDMTLNAKKAWFQQRADAHMPGEQSLTINGLNGDDGVAIFDGPVGRKTPLEFLQVNGTSAINGQWVITRDYQHYNGATTIGDDTNLISLAAGDIHFYETLNGGHDLFIYTDGVTRFDGEVGNLERPTLLWTDFGGQSEIGADQDADKIDFGDPVFLSNDVVVRGRDRVKFRQTIDGNGHDLLVRSPLTFFHGDVTRMGALETDADGVTFLSAREPDADGVLTMKARSIKFGDSVELCSDAFLTGRHFVNFDSTLNGPFNVTTNSNRWVRFGGDVGGTRPLSSLTTNVGSPDLIDSNLVLIDGRLMRVLNDISFNPGGRSLPAEVATIAARNRQGVLIESIHGGIFMGPNEKMTGLGDLTLKAEGAPLPLAGNPSVSPGTILIGDLNAHGDIRIVSDDIRIRSRDGRRVLDYQGNYLNDRRTEIIATGMIDFSSKPTKVGGGLQPIFVTRSGNGFSSTLDGFNTFDFKGLGINRYTYTDTVLDLTLPGVQPPPPPPAPPAPPREPVLVSNLAQGLGDGPTRIKDRVPLDPYALRPMERLAIYMRSLNNEELQGTVTGRELYNDIPSQPTTAANQLTLVTNRLRRPAVLDVLDKHAALFLRERANTSNSTVMEDQSAYIRDALSRAWTAYTAREGAAGDQNAAELMAYLESQPDHQEALAMMKGLQEMFRELWVMGVTRLELRNSINGVLGPITPEAMGQPKLEEALQIEQIG